MYDLENFFTTTRAPFPFFIMVIILKICIFASVGYN